MMIPPSRESRCSVELPDEHLYALLLALCLILPWVVLHLHVPVPEKQDMGLLSSVLGNARRGWIERLIDTAIHSFRPGIPSNLSDLDLDILLLTQAGFYAMGLASDTI